MRLVLTSKLFLVPSPLASSRTQFFVQMSGDSLLAYELVGTTYTFNTVSSYCLYCKKPKDKEGIM